MSSIPKTQTAIQLCGPGELRMNTDKQVHRPAGHQILCKVITVGLCFSDLKLLKQFSNHVRKSEVESGIDPEILKTLPSYVPGDKPTVPGHEVAVEIAETGEDATKFKPGERYIIQADWRWLKTKNSNGAFGYNFEGGLQEYVILDERIVFAPEGEAMLLPIDTDDISVSAFALVEPWACVEESYQSKERHTIKSGGKLLIVVDQAQAPLLGDDFFESCGKPDETILLADDLDSNQELQAIASETVASITSLSDCYFDDILYFGSDPALLEKLFSKADKNCLINIVTGGEQFDRDVDLPLGDIHYRGLRITGTTSDDAAAGYQSIPPISEIRPMDRIHIVGAGGPMGVMHVMRNLCQGVEGIEVNAADLSTERIDALDKLAKPAATRNNVKYLSYCPTNSNPDAPFDYSVIMAPVPALCAEAVKLSEPKAIINIFAGIPAGKSGPVDLDSYISRNLYFVGTSGSVMEDMKIVKDKVENGSLDTNVSVAAITGFEGAIEGLKAVERQEIPGKILVYPACKGLTLMPLDKLEDELPKVYQKLCNGVWTKAAEDELLT